MPEPKTKPRKPRVPRVLTELEQKLTDEHARQRALSRATKAVARILGSLPAADAQAILNAVESALASSTGESA